MSISSVGQNPVALLTRGISAAPSASSQTLEGKYTFEDQINPLTLKQRSTESTGVLPSSTTSSLSVNPEISYTSGNLAANSGATLDLTQSDRAFIFAATGLTAQPNGDISGQPLPGEKMVRPPDLLLQISNARKTGTLTGDVTAQDLSRLATGAAASGHSWPVSYLQNGLAYLESPASSKQAAIKSNVDVLT